MRELLTRDLKNCGRPFGEFVPGGNATPGGQIDEQIALVKTVTVRGKDVIVPGTNEASKKQPNRRDARKAARAKAKG